MTGFWYRFSNSDEVNILFVFLSTPLEEENRLVLGSRETHGYFADSQEYMQLYNTIRASFEAFKVIFGEVEQGGGWK